MSADRIPAAGGVESAASAAPVVRIVSGSPSAEDIAALVAVLSAVGGGEEPAPAPASSAWSDPSWRLVGPSATRGGWRTSSLPR